MKKQKQKGFSEIKSFVRVGDTDNNHCKANKYSVYRVSAKNIELEQGAIVRVSDYTRIVFRRALYINCFPFPKQQ